MGKVTIAADAADASGIARVEFRVDGVRVATDMAPPYQYLWDTGTVANGDHTLSVRAVDTVGNRSSSEAVVVTVDNPAPPSLSALSATAAHPKTRLTLFGSGFDAATVHVTIGDKYAPVVELATGTITVKVPRLPKYAIVSVVIANGTAASSPLALEIR